MRNIVLTTESGSDLNPDIQKRYDIRILPMHVSMGENTFDDGSIPISKLYEYFDKTKDTPKSSADNVQDYIDFFTRIREEDPDCVIYNLALSSGISTNYDHSLLAAREFKDVYTIDTRVFSAGDNAYCVEAGKLLEARGGSAGVSDYDAFAEELSQISKYVSSSFVPDSLEFLRAGGRVTNAAYIASSAFRIKPLIIPDELGRLKAGGRYRGKMINVCDKYVIDICNRYDVDRDTLYIMHTEGVADGVLEKMEKTAYDLGFKNISHNTCGGIITCHGGKAAVGLGIVMKH